MMGAARIALALAVSAWAGALRADDGAPIVVWVAAEGAEQDSVFPIAASWVEELHILVVREEVAEPIGDLEAERMRAEHGAVAVAWHDRAGALRVMFAGERSSERVAVDAGGTAEEGLYLRELIAARLAVGADLGAALVTVPDEVVETRMTPLRRNAEAQLRGEAAAGGRSRRWGAKIGAGYFAAAHLDDVLWWQQGIRLAAPELRPSDVLQIGLEVELGLPASIGSKEEAWLEMRTVCASMGAEIFPLHRAVAEIELGLNAGPLFTAGVAFLSSGESASASVLSGHVTGLLGLVIHPTPRLDIRFRFDLRYVIRPPSFGIGGIGDFGARPWQPGGGIDLAYSLSPR